MLHRPKPAAARAGLTLAAALSFVLGVTALNLLVCTFLLPNFSIFIANSLFTRGGFLVVERARGPANRFPLWIIALFYIGAAWGIRRMRDHLYPGRKQGHCRQCAYNLTGNQSGVCPECGTEVVML